MAARCAGGMPARAAGVASTEAGDGGVVRTGGAVSREVAPANTRPMMALTIHSSESANSTMAKPDAMNVSVSVMFMAVG